jgi:serine/threonine-protein kinase
MREHAYIIRPTPLPLPTAARLGPYEVLAKLGEGGMGEVYRARDTKLGRDVALKILPDGFATIPIGWHGSAARRRCWPRSTIPTSLASTVSRIPATPRRWYWSLSTGPTLADRIAQGPLPVEESLQIAQADR